MSDKYIFLTGATGLLGSYLLKDLLKADRRCVVVVRANRFENAVQRIESILARFEQEVGFVLPRPVVLEGDLSQPEFGLKKEEQEWVRKHCDTMLHNAASLSFQVDEKTNEPYRSNVEGTRNVLEFCRKTGIRQFHHVSTAYVAGLRTGLCRESELDVGQEFGNDYENSKVQAEKLVRAAGFLDSLTTYRPSIIIGDSQTGYTSTYHGFYTPLKIVHSFIRSEVIDGTPFLGVIGMTGTERKHFVPVDWVSEASVRILTTPALHDKVYHLTPLRPITSKTTLRVFEDALKRFVKEKGNHSRGDAAKTQDSISNFNMSMLGEMFREQMEVYKAYWRDDPSFDRTNIEAALPNCPCPNVHYAMLIRLSLFALRNGFGWPRSQPILPNYRVCDVMSKHIGSDRSVKNAAYRLGLQVNGPGGSGWTVVCDSRGQIADCAAGLPVDGTPLVYMNVETFRRMTGGGLSLTDALRLGAVHVENPDHVRQFETLFAFL